MTGLYSQDYLQYITPSLLQFHTAVPCLVTLVMLINICAFLTTASQNDCSQWRFKAEFVCNANGRASVIIKVSNTPYMALQKARGYIASGNLSKIIVGLTSL